jgi:hypothetical protein
MSECVWNFSTLSTMNESSENKNWLARGSVLNFLNSSLQETFSNTCHYSNNSLLDFRYSFAVCWLSSEDDIWHDGMEISKPN